MKTKEVEKGKRDKKAFSVREKIRSLAFIEKKSRLLYENARLKISSHLCGVVDYMERQELFSKWGKREYARGILYFLSAFILSFAVIGNARPFGISFALALNEKGKSIYKVFSFFGLAFALFFIEGGIFFLLSFIFAFLLGEIITIKKGKIPSGVNVTMALSGAISSVVLLPLGLVDFALSFIGIFVLTLSLQGLFRGGKRVLPLCFDCGFMALALGFTMAFSGVNIGIFSFGIITAVFFCLEGAKRGGYYLGALTGFVAGLAQGGIFMVALPVCAFVCGALKNAKRVVFTLSFNVLLVVIFALTTDGKDLFVLVFNSLWAGLLWCSISFLLLDKKRASLPVLMGSLKNAEEKKFSDALYVISLSLSAVSKSKRREREEKIKVVIEGIFEKECETCNACRLNPVSEINRICQRVMKNKRISENDFSDYFASICPRKEMIIDKINSLIEKQPFKTSLRIDSLAEDYMTISRVLSHSQTRAEGRYYKNVSLAREIRIALEKRKIYCQRVDVTGERLPEIEIYGIPFKIPVREKAIKKEIEGVLSSSVEQILFETEGDVAKIGFKAVCPLKIHCYKTTIPKLGEIISGDSTTVFALDDGYFYSLINDGMGSGRDASICSRLGATFLEKLITAGVDKCGAVSMLGNIISASEDEIFTTVDLTEIDLVRGKISFLKAGASPSWILREGRAYSISSKTLPCGILSKSTAEQTVVDCYSGDLIIMSSDGGEWAGEAVESIEKILGQKSNNPEEVARFLAKESARKTNRSDDISFCVMSVI